METNGSDGLDYISQDKPQAAIDWDDEFETAAERTCGNPGMYKLGRVKGPREAVVRPHYVLVCQTTEEGVLTVLRVLHAAPARVTCYLTEISAVAA